MLPVWLKLSRLAAFQASSICAMTRPAARTISSASLSPEAATALVVQLCGGTPGSVE
jgi:hypothetical protein